MITGRQIREARKFLGWDLATLSSMTGVPVDSIKRAERVEGTPSIMLNQGLRLQAFMEKAGARFGNNGAVMMTAPLKKLSARSWRIALRVRGWLERSRVRANLTYLVKQRKLVVREGEEAASRRKRLRAFSRIKNYDVVSTWFTLSKSTLKPLNFFWVGV